MRRSPAYRSGWPAPGAGPAAGPAPQPRAGTAPDRCHQHPATARPRAVQRGGQQHIRLRSGNPSRGPPHAAQPLHGRRGVAPGRHCRARYLRRKIPPARAPSGDAQTRGPFVACQEKQDSHRPKGQQWLFSGLTAPRPAPPAPGNCPPSTPPWSLRSRTPFPGSWRRSLSLEGKRQTRAAGAIRAAGPGLPRHLRSCRTKLAGLRRPSQGMSRRERPGAGHPLRDPRRRRPR